MNLSVSGKQIEIGDALRGHAGRTLDAAVAKYFDGAIEGEVRFSREAHLFRADIVVHIGRNITMQSHAAAVDPYGAFDSACDHLAKRLRRHKRRLRDHNLRAARDDDTVTARQAILAAPGDDEGDHALPDGTGDVHTSPQPVVIAEMKTQIETLSVGEAVLRLDFTGQPAMLFRSRANGLLNMVYRRPDGNIGWVDPQNVEH
jgi:ribosomal subunit interface protein